MEREYKFLFLLRGIIMKLKKKVVLCVSVVVMVVSFLCFGIVSFAEDPDEITRKPEVLNVKYLNESYITNPELFIGLT